jgi:predicted Zn-dependent peptidase
VQKIKAQDVVDQIKTMTSQPQRILYYGDLSLTDLQKVITDKHSVHPAKKPAKMGPDYDRIATKENAVYFAHYDAKQSLCRQLSTSVPANWGLSPQIEMYNEYFGGSMNSIVFQEIREKRSLAYSAAAYYVEPSEKGKCNYNMTHIGTQNDKLIDAMEAFTDLLDNMPVSELNFDLAKTSLISQYRTNRTRKMSIINYYLTCEEMGLKTPLDRTSYNLIQKMTMNDVVNFNKSYIKGQKRVVVVLGNENEVDLKGLEKYGHVKKLSLEEIFGY